MTLEIPDKVSWQQYTNEQKKQFLAHLREALAGLNLANETAKLISSSSKQALLEQCLHIVDLIIESETGEGNILTEAEILYRSKKDLLNAIGSILRAGM